MAQHFRRALIIGAGSGLSAALARKFRREGLEVALAARDTGKLAALADETGAVVQACNAADHGDIAALFASLDAGGAPDVVVYNPSARAAGPIATLDPEAVTAAVQVTALGAFYAAHEAAKRMEPHGHGAILLTGATAGVKGYAGSAAFAMGKFALRGLAQSLARELHPKGIHIGHFIIDGGIRNPDRPGRGGDPAHPDALLEPDGIAESYWHFLTQHRSSWSWEMELRPWVERF